jgi:hypothetical protein
MTKKLLTVLAVGLLAAAPSIASAQIGTSISLAAGLALPSGEGSDQVNSGYNVAAGLNIGVPLLPVGVRLEGAYNAFESKGNTSTNSSSTNIFSATANGTFGLGLPYVIGGLGYYSAGGSAKVGGTDVKFDRENAVGINGGVGVRFPLGVISTFAEIRYHKMLGDKNKGGDLAYIPITFGINF